MASVSLAFDVPQHHRWCNTQSRHEGRNHLDPTLVQKVVPRAVLAAAIPKPAGCHTRQNRHLPVVVYALLLQAADAAPKRLRPEAPAALPVATVRG